MKKLTLIITSLFLWVMIGYSGSFYPITGQELYMAYHDSPYANVVLGTKKGTLHSKAYTAYNRGDYTEAVNLFKVLLNTEKTATNYFYAGVANLEAGNTADAKRYFSVTLNYFGEFKEQAQWGMAMSALHENNINEAFISLLPLKLNNSGYASQVDEILETLEISLTDRETGTGETTWIEPLEDKNFQESNYVNKSIQEVRRTYHLIVKGDNGRRYEIISNSPIDAGSGDFVVFGILEEGTDKSPGLAYLVRVIGG